MDDMIGISVSVADTEGALILRMTPDSDVSAIRRRVSRTATLDGGCAISDAGFSHADRTLSVEAEVSEAVWTAIRTIMEAYSLVRIALAEGFFEGCIESGNYTEGRAVLSILMKEKLA